MFFPLHQIHLETRIFLHSETDTSKKCAYHIFWVEVVFKVIHKLLSIKHSPAALKGGS